MTKRYERLLIDSCPRRRGWLRWQLGSPLFLAAPGSGPVSSHAQPNPSQHTVTCLVTSCVVAKPFPITQAHAPLYPVCQLNPSSLVHVCFLLFQHSTIWHTGLTLHFPRPSSYSMYEWACPKCLYGNVFGYIFSHEEQSDGLVSPPCQSNNSSSPDTSVSVSSVEAGGNEALPIYWSPYTPLCIRETLFSLPNRNTVPSVQ